MTFLRLFVGLVLLTSHLAHAENAQPHIILALADDLGVGDICSYGGTVCPTPHLDRMAKEGARFTQYYSASPICSPSRCGLLTGQFPSRWQITSYLQTRAGNRECQQVDYLTPQAPTLPAILKTAGYKTAHVGKWHLGGGRDVVEPPKFASYGYDLGLGTYESPEPAPALGSKTTPWGKEVEPQQVPRHQRSRWMVDQTLAFVHANPSKPCFVNLWFDDPHTPWKPENAENQAAEGKSNLIGVLTELDTQMGRLMAELPANTLLIFASDNGPLPTFQGSRTNGLRGSKLSLYEGGIRLPFLARWAGKIPAAHVDTSTVFQAVDFLPSLATVAGAKIPATALPDGIDLSAAILGKPRQRTKPLFWEYGRNPTSFKYPKAADKSPSLAIRDGQWKFLANTDGSQPELYDLDADPKETNNLATQKPEHAAKLKEQLDAWQATWPKFAVTKP